MATTTELVITLMRDKAIALSKGQGESLAALVGRVAPGVVVISGNQKYSVRVRATAEQQKLLRRNAEGLFRVDSATPMDLFDLLDLAPICGGEVEVLLKEKLLELIGLARQRVRFHRIAKGFGPGIERQSRMAIDEAKRDMRAAWRVFNLSRNAPEKE